MVAPGAGAGGGDSNWDSSSFAKIKSSRYEGEDGHMTVRTHLMPLSCAPGEVLVADSVLFAFIRTAEHALDRRVGLGSAGYFCPSSAGEVRGGGHCSPQSVSSGCREQLPVLGPSGSDPQAL